MNTTEELAEAAERIVREGGNITHVLIHQHGNQGVQMIGNSSVLAPWDSGTKRLGEAIGEDSEIECKGCNVAEGEEGEEGEEYIEGLADATGASVTGYTGQVRYIPTPWGPIYVWHGGDKVTKAPCEKTGDGEDDKAKNKHTPSP